MATDDRPLPNAPRGQVPEGLPERTFDTFVPLTRSVAHDPSDDSFPSMVLPTWAVTAPPTSSSGRPIPLIAGENAGNGRGVGYRLMKRLGSGGMGEVWSALQSTLARPVAVKRLLPERLCEGAQSVADAVIEFQLEAMVAGRLEHPNIVPIHDLGADENGHPLIAMKLVEGKTWSELIAADFDAMSPPDFLGKHLPILISMANAVAFAHDRGVVHRDLKPSQVMVGAFGETMLMDWGLAIAWKDTERPDAPALNLPTTMSATNPAGTPALMAPEQAQGDAKRVGTHTDVFLLGGTLYFLLTGTYPYQAATSQAAFLKAMVVDQERPELRQPRRWIPKGLADIAMTAMSPEIAARHSSAAAFRDAVVDWMTGAAQRREAQSLIEQAGAELDAHPASYDAFGSILHQLDRARALWSDSPRAETLRTQAKEGFARKALAANDLTLAHTQASTIDHEPTRRTLLAAVDHAMREQQQREAQRRWSMRAVIWLLAALLLASVFYAYNIDSARRAEIAARQESDRQRDLADAARKEAERNLDIAKAQGEGAFNVILYVLDELKGAMETEFSVERGLTVTEANEMKHAIAGAVASPTVRYFQELDTSSWPKAMRLEHSRRMLETGDRFREMGRFDEALLLTTPTLEVRSELLGGDDPETAASLNNIASLMQDEGRFDDALRYNEQALAIHIRAFGSEHPNTALSLNNLGVILRSMGRLEDARKHFGRALEIREKALGAYHIETAESLNNLASLERDLGHLESARVLYVRALAIREETLGADHPDTAASLNNLALVLGAMDRAGEAMPLFERAVAITERALGPSHPETAASINNLAGALYYLGEKERALELQERALGIRERALGVDHPQIANSLNNIAVTLRDLGRPEEALRRYELALAILEKSFGADNLKLVGSIGNMATLLQEMGRLDEALPLMERAVAICERSLDESNIETAQRRAELAWILYTMGRAAEAKPLFERALAIYDEEFGPDDKRTRLIRIGVFRSIAELGRAAHLIGKIDVAKPFFEQALQLWETGPGMKEVKSQHYRAECAEVLLRCGRVDEARALFAGLTAQGWPGDNASDFERELHATLAKDLSND